MKVNDLGLELIKEFEGCSLDAYKDIVGVWTIGYGATGKDVVEGLKWTPEQCNERLAIDVGKFSKGVADLVRVKINDNQFSALVCFSYNVGLGNFKSSTLLRRVNSSDFTGVADQFRRWAKAGGQEIPGLVRRRAAEKELFLRPLEDQTG